MGRFSILVLAAFALSAAPAWADQSVTIQDCGSFCHQFAPATINAPTGEQVTWTSQSTVPHTVTRCTPAACNGVGGGTGTDSWTGTTTALNSGGSYSNAFTGAGTYVYYCMIHGYSVMHGTITVTGAPLPPDNPTASFTANPTNPTTGQSVTFDGSASSDTDGDSIMSYQWDFGDGVAQTTATPTVTHAYANAGSFTAKLMVRDSRGTLSAVVSQAVVVTQPPVDTPGGKPPLSAPVASKLRLSAAKLCAKQFRTCTHTHARASFTLSSAVTVKLVVKHRRQVVRMKTVRGKAGKNSIPLSAAGLKPGKYVLVLRPGRGKAIQVTFKVVAP